MKKIIGLLLAIMIVAGCFSICAVAEAATTDVFVTFSDNSGKIILSQEKITVTDKNGDGKFDLDEAFFAMHEAKYEGGAAAGYATGTSQYGLYITKLWGDTSGNFSYYVNNKMAMGLTDEIKAGDYLNAFIFQVYEFNPETYETTSDSYSFFDKFNATVTEGDKLTVTLKAVVFDADYAPINVNVAEAIITIDGVETTLKTDENGKVTIPMDKVGEYLISAKKVDDILVPPVLKVTVNAKPQATTENKSPKTGDDLSILVFMVALSGALAAFAAKKVYEK
ncbi:MAG: hypothetical protein J5766_04025 [Clostridia bacterium]|nr:hypothetical protein [Clostridia bacterium]